MSRNVLVVVDMQNDFVNGALGTAEAQAIVPAVVAKVENDEGEVVVTQYTHPADYLQSQEGRNLPVEHCIKGTEGWQLIEPLHTFASQRGARIFEKPTFGSVALAHWLSAEHAREAIDEIEFIGLCTDICVVSNALLAKATLPEVPVAVDASCCAGVTPATHDAALATMGCCQVEVR